MSYVSAILGNSFVEKNAYFVKKVTKIGKKWTFMKIFSNELVRIFLKVHKIVVLGLIDLTMVAKKFVTHFDHTDLSF